MENLSLLSGNTTPAPSGKLTKVPAEKKLSDECLILRYCMQVLKMSINEIGDILGFSEATMKKMYYGYRNKAGIGEFNKLYEALGIDKEVLVMYVHNWRDNNGSMDPDLPFYLYFLGNDGNPTKERFWFQYEWFRDNFRDEKYVSLIRLEDNSIASYGFCRGDIVIASRLPEHILFRTRCVYMLRERDGGIYPRIAEIPSRTGDEPNRVLRSAIDSNDELSFDSLPAGVTLLGRLVWKSGMI